jgi:hypothetical protein
VPPIALAPIICIASMCTAKSNFINKGLRLNAIFPAPSRMAKFIRCTWTTELVYYNFCCDYKGNQFEFWTGDRSSSPYCSFSQLLQPNSQMLWQGLYRPRLLYSSRLFHNSYVIFQQLTSLFSRSRTEQVEKNGHYFERKITYNYKT